MLRALAISAGLAWAVLFIVVALAFGLQLYADGSIFSYAVAVQDVWAFHWHNLSGRLSVFFLTLWPAETFVALTGSPRGGIAVYGLLFYSAPLAGLIGTYAADRSKGRIIFAYACGATALLGPLVFGFPTEMWLAQALFWPALAAAHCTRRDAGGIALAFVLLLALVFSHEGALVLAFAIVATLALRGWRDAAFRRGAGALIAAPAIWAAVKAAYPPDAYFADAYRRAALHFFDLTIFKVNVVLVLLATVAGYALAWLALVRAVPGKAHLYAAVIVAVALGVYWLAFDHALHASNRYYLRTALVVATPALGMLAALYALRAEGRLNLPIAGVERAMTALTCGIATRALAGLFVLVTLVHAVETGKFVAAWNQYKAAVRALATGATSDPALGDPRFVSSQRIGADLNRLSWFSTTQYLGAVLANFAPARLVIDPTGNYFWLTCETATANARAQRAVPADVRELVRVHACQHR